MRVLAAVTLFLVWGCGTQASDPVDAGGGDAGVPSPLGTCASSFGRLLTPGFGRIDGTLVAIVPPDEQSCAMPNRDHLVAQVQMGAAVYRMVVNVASSRAGADQRVRLGTFEMALPAPGWGEGWHPGVSLDYPAMGVHASRGFVPMEMGPLVEALVDALKIGTAISVYATSGAGRPESAHLIHRNGHQDDGAIVLDPTSANPRFLLFHFPDQTF